MLCVLAEKHSKGSAERVGGNVFLPAINEKIPAEPAETFNIHFTPPVEALMASPTVRP
jgi:hypothetical protein